MAVRGQESCWDSQGAYRALLDLRYVTNDHAPLLPIAGIYSACS